MMKIKFHALPFLLIFVAFSHAQNKSISEEKYVTIGGIEQWITIKGKDISKPVILFIHGGPGSTMSQYDDAMYGAWEKDFILVHWDQRGAGRTYGRNAPKELNEDYLIENPLTVEQMTNDGIELTKYLIDHLNKKKVILIGTSWGSILSVKMSLKNPALFYAYIGHAQFVNFSENIGYAYTKVLEMAENNKDNEAIELLGSLGKPPYDNAKNYGQLLRIIKKYERENSQPAPDTWFKLATEYENEKDSKDRYEGDDYSFINLVGHKKLGIKSMVSDVDFKSNELAFKIPVYFIQGAADILTSEAINRTYFDKITAPKKEYFLIPNAAHGFNQAVIDKQYEIVSRYISIK